MLPSCLSRETAAFLSAAHFLAPQAKAYLLSSAACVLPGPGRLPGNAEHHGEPDPSHAGGTGTAPTE